jgi:hypothetical protein
MRAGQRLGFEDIVTLHAGTSDPPVRKSLHNQRTGATDDNFKLEPDLLSLLTYSTITGLPVGTVFAGRSLIRSLI